MNHLKKVKDNNILNNIQTMNTLLLNLVQEKGIVDIITTMKCEMEEVEKKLLYKANLQRYVNFRNITREAVKEGKMDIDIRIHGDLYAIYDSWSCRGSVSRKVNTFYKNIDKLLRNDDDWYIINVRANGSYKRANNDRFFVLSFMYLKLANRVNNHTFDLNYSTV